MWNNKGRGLTSAVWFLGGHIWRLWPPNVCGRSLGPGILCGRHSPTRRHCAALRRRPPTSVWRTAKPRVFDRVPGAFARNARHTLPLAAKLHALRLLSAGSPAAFLPPALKFQRPIPESRGRGVRVPRWLPAVSALRRTLAENGASRLSSSRLARAAVSGLTIVGMGLPRMAREQPRFARRQTIVAVIGSVKTLAIHEKSSLRDRS